MAEWTRELPSAPGIFDHRNLENAGGRAPIKERVVFVGYVNWPEDPKKGHGKKPMPLGSGKLRACRVGHPMTTDSLTVQEWGGEWQRIDGVGYASPKAATEQEKELGAYSISRATIGVRTHDRRSEESNRGVGEEKQHGGETGRGDAVRAGGAKSGARGNNAAQHEVAAEPGPSAPADTPGVPPCVGGQE